MMHYVYKLTVGGIPYFGYTSRDPRVRLKEHLDIAYKQNWKHFSKLYMALVDAEYEHEFEIVYEEKEEVPALLREIELIRDNPVNLNLTRGGEGKTKKVKTRLCLLYTSPSPRD